MKISELIEKLGKVKADKGDLEVYANWDKDFVVLLEEDPVAGNYIVLE